MLSEKTMEQFKLLVAGQVKPMDKLNYSLFLYREELNRRNSKFVRAATIKVHLTETLIQQSLCKMQYYDVPEIRNLSREILYKRHLTEEIQAVRKLKKLGIRVDPRELQNEWH